jgi:hypothetical protein
LTTEIPTPKTPIAFGISLRGKTLKTNLTVTIERILRLFLLEETYQSGHAGTGVGCFLEHAQN